MEKLANPELPDNPTLEDIEQHHRDLRRWDSDRVAYGIASAVEVQRENSWLVPEGIVSKIDWTYGASK